MRSVSFAATHEHHVSTVTLRGVLIALAAVVAVAVSGIAGMLPAAAGGRPPGGTMTNPVVRSIDLASPAVVRIATLYSARLSLSACGHTTTLPASGTYTVGGLGSGAFVSANGDILTADHVVDIDHQSLDDSIFASQKASGDIAAFLNAACHPSVPVTPDDVANGIVQFNGLPFSTSYSGPRVLVWRSASYAGTINAKGDTATTLLAGLLKAPYHEATVTKTSTFEQDDVALLHVGLTDTPSIQLDSSSDLAVEDTLAVIGFPGNGDVNGDPTNLLTPSINNVNVSAIKRNDNGSQLIQVGGNVEHGDSGGPALDAAGHIAGIVSFGGVDAPGITAFLRSSDSALSLLNAVHVDTKPGTFQTLWQQAFADYADTTPGHWHTASREMDALSARYPDFHGLDAYRQYADAAAVNEAVPSSSSQGLVLPLPLPIVAAIGVGIVLLVVLLIVIIIVRGRARRRAKRQQQQPAIQQPAWASPGMPQGYNTYNPPSQAGGPAIPRQEPFGYPSQPAPQGAPPAYAPAHVPAQSPGVAAAYPSPYAGYPAQASPLPSNASPANVPPANASPASATGQLRLDSPTPPSTPSQNGAGERCVNGHQMPPGAVHCPICGTGRASFSTPSAIAPRDASASPWTLNQ